MARSAEGAARERAPGGAREPTQPPPLPRRRSRGARRRGRQADRRRCVL